MNIDGQEVPENPEHVETSAISGDHWQISLPKTRIHTLEQLIEYCQIDTDVWEVKKWICNKWEVGRKEKEVNLSWTKGAADGYVYDTGKIFVEPLFQVKAYLERRKNVVEAQRIIDRLIQKAESHAPQYPEISVVPSDSGNVVEISIVDVHDGALIWAKETGWDDWDTNLAVSARKAAVEDILGKAEPYKPERALLVLGNDQVNVDNRAGNTEAGTPQSNDGRYQKVVDASTDASIWTIDACLLKYGSVDVMMVPGNHDPLTTYHMGKVLAAWYRNAPQVRVFNSPNPRKYYEHGINMLMFWHGNKGKVEDYLQTMAAEQPEMWGRTRWREAHTADKHQRRLIEGRGGAVRILPSLRPSCAWSAENNFVGAIRAAEAYVWNDARGLVGTLCYSILKK